MNRATLKKMEELFHQMAADLSTVIVGKPGRMLCPLCLSEFGLSDIEHNLSIEHVIPQSAKGKVLTLTCHDCNHNLGAEIDSVFARKYKLDKALETGKEIGGKLKAEGFGAPAFMSFLPEGLKIRLEPTTPYMEAVLVEKFSQYEKGERAFNLKLNANIDRAKFAASLVKTAYLGLFKDWGYKYAVLPMLDPIRNAIKSPGSERDRLINIVVPATLTNVVELGEEPTRLSFDSVCGGVKASCSVLNGVFDSAYWVILPPISALDTGSIAGLERAANSLKGKSLTVTFPDTFLKNGIAVIQEVS